MSWRVGECQVRPQDIEQFLEIARGVRIEGIVSENDDTYSSLMPVENYHNPKYKSTTVNLEERLKKTGVSNISSSKPLIIEENINYGLKRPENEYEAICENPTNIIASITRSEDNEFLEDIMECLPATQAASKDGCALKETEKVSQLPIFGSQTQCKDISVFERIQDDPAISKILSLTVRVLTADGRQSDIKDVATARVLLNRHLLHAPPPLLPATLSEIAMDTNKVVAVLRSLWKHEGFAWGNNSSYYDFMNVSIPIESFSPQTKHVFRNESNTTVKLSDIIEIMEEPSLKPRLSKKYMNQSKREIHVIIIEALLRMNKKDPENYYLKNLL